MGIAALRLLHRFSPKYAYEYRPESPATINIAGYPCVLQHRDCYDGTATWAATSWHRQQLTGVGR